ncbi:MAG: polysaccharide deacetylase family protein [Halodesulfovibrio sp.]
MLKQGLKQILAGTYGLRGTEPGLSVLMYHRVSHDALLSVPPDVFEEQMALLARDFEPISLRSAVERLGRGDSCNGCVCVTFDDGFQDNWTTAYPILEKHGVPATVFVACDALTQGTLWFYAFDDAVFSAAAGEADLTAFGLGVHTWQDAAGKMDAVGRVHDRMKQFGHAELLSIVQAVASAAGGKRIMMTPEECKKLAASGLVDIGAHTVSHPILTGLPDDALVHEIMNGKSMLEAMIGREVSLFSYPNGTARDFDDRVVEVVRRAGFDAAVTTMPGLNRAGANPFTLRRFDVTPGVYTGWNGRYSKGLFRSHVRGTLHAVIQKMAAAM